jgi:hypothetical protein
MLRETGSKDGADRGWVKTLDGETACIVDEGYFHVRGIMYLPSQDALELEPEGPWDCSHCAGHEPEFTSRLLLLECEGPSGYDRA